MRVRFARLLQKNINISPSVDRILIIYNTENSLTVVVSSCHERDNLEENETLPMATQSYPRVPQQMH